MLRKKRVRKGYILIYAFFMGSICVLTTLYLLSFEFDRFNQETYKSRNLNKEDLLKKQREYILTYIDSFLYNNLTKITNENVFEFINTKANKERFYYDKSVGYFVKNNIYVDYYLRGLFYKREVYDLSVESSNIKYKKVSTKYVLEI